MINKDEHYLADHDDLRSPDEILKDWNGLDRVKKGIIELEEIYKSGLISKKKYNLYCEDIWDRLNNYQDDRYFDQFDSNYTQQYKEYKVEIYLFKGA